MEKTYVKKPVKIQAVIWTGENPVELTNFMGISLSRYQEIGQGIDPGDGLLKINTPEGQMIALPGDYIIRGIKGEYYPCKPDIFALTYEEVDPDIHVPAADEVDLANPPASDPEGDVSDPTFPTIQPDTTMKQINPEETNSGGPSSEA